MGGTKKRRDSSNDAVVHDDDLSIWKLYKGTEETILTSAKKNVKMIEKLEERINKK